MAVLASGELEAPRMGVQGGGVFPAQELNEMHTVLGHSGPNHRAMNLIDVDLNAIGAAKSSKMHCD